MNEPTMDKLVQRLDRLEKENRRMKRIGALVAVGIAAVVLMGQARSSKVAKVIEAEKFVLRDTSGQVGAILFTVDEGSPHLEFRDKKRNLRITLGVMSSTSPRTMSIETKRRPESSLVLFDEKGQVIWKAP